MVGLGVAEVEALVEVADDVVVIGVVDDILILKEDVEGVLVDEGAVDWARDVVELVEMEAEEEMLDFEVLVAIVVLVTLVELVAFEELVAFVELVAFLVLVNMVECDVNEE